MTALLALVLTGAASRWAFAIPTPPAAPTGLAATVLSAARIRLDWTDNSDNETAFAVWRKSGAGDFARVGVVPLNTTTFTDSGLEPATRYTYRVRAANDFYASAWSNEVDATTQVGPTVTISVPPVATSPGVTRAIVTYTLPPGYQLYSLYLLPRVRAQSDRGEPIEWTPALPTAEPPNGQFYVDLLTGLFPSGAYQVRGEVYYIDPSDPNGKPVIAISPWAPMTVLAPYPFRLELLSIIEAGNSLTAQLGMSSRVLTSPVVVNLSSSNPAVASVPATVTVPPGEQGATFTVTTGAATATTPVTITASTDTGSQSAPLTVVLVRGVAVFHTATAEWRIREVDGMPTRVSFGMPGDQPVPADYAGVGHAQPAVFRPSTAEWLIRGADGGTTEVSWGSPGDQPVPGDYLGLGHAQIAVFRPSTGEWRVRRPDSTAWIVGLGQNGDRPVPADYAGVGRLQMAVFRPETAEWLLRRDDGTVTLIQWGNPGEVPVPADYAGVGHAQLAVFHPSFADWTIRNDDGSARVGSLGQAGDVPVPGDYFGVGRAQIAIFRPLTGDWILSLELDLNHQLRFSWGVPNDLPVPARYSSR